MNNLLSIIIPTYNRQSGLDLLITSLNESINRGEFDQLVELVIIDDFSANQVVIPKVSCTVTLNRNNKNLGAPLSREIGFQESKGKFIHFHDSDDSITESWLFETINQLQSKPDVDILLTGRIDVDASGESDVIQKYFHKQVLSPKKIQSRLIYRNCMGPLGGAVFSRRVLGKVTFKPFLSCQDWQMYIDAIEHAKVLKSRPDIQFIFNKSGADRISSNPRKKILGHAQLAKITAPKSPFKKSLRLFYLYTCKQHVFNHGGGILRFYKKNRVRIVLAFLVISIYWRLT